MSLDRVPAGRDVPNDCNVVIEIPMRADPIKYEVDKETGAVFVDRFMSTAMHYPCNYGYIPQTLSDDGDPVRRARALAGSAHHRRRRALPADRHAQDGRRGRRRQQDPRGADRQAVVAVPRRASRRATCPQITTQQIAHFFEHYKDLEPGKWVRVASWVEADEAKREILESVARYKKKPPRAKK